MTLKLPPLPELLRVACEAGGMEAVQALSEAFGGKQIYIPTRNCGDDHPLVQVAGRAVANAICDRWNTQNVEFPFGRGAVRTWLAASLVAEGASLNTMAGKLRISFREARRLKKRIERGGTLAHMAPGQKRDGRQIDIEDYLSQPPKRG
jgi:hypothetical protein